LQGERPHKNIGVNDERRTVNGPVTVSGSSPVELDPVYAARSGTRGLRKLEAIWLQFVYLCKQW